MHLSKKVIENLADVIIGQTSKNVTPYLYGADLVELFNECGFNDDYSKDKLDGMSRRNYTIDKLEKLNDNHIERPILKLLQNIRYFDTVYKVEDIAAYLGELLKFDNYKLVYEDNKYKIMGEGIDNEEIEVEACFERIKSMIINEIRNAKYCIWISVAWFTDKELFDELLLKQEQGVNIQLVISNDETNMTLERKYGIIFEDYFETYRINPYGIYDDDIVHNKFCVIDLETVLEGSYNWTIKATYNKEHLERIKYRENACKYASRFIELKIGEN